MMLAQALSGVLAQVGSGRIVGGWEYVWTSYGLTWTVIAVYGLTLWLRSRGAKTSED